MQTFHHRLGRCPICSAFTEGAWTATAVGAQRLIVVSNRIQAGVATSHCFYTDVINQAHNTALTAASVRSEFTSPPATYCSSLFIFLMYQSIAYSVPPYPLHQAITVSVLNACSSYRRTRMSSTRRATPCSSPTRARWSPSSSSTSWTSRSCSTIVRRCDSSAFSTHSTRRSTRCARAALRGQRREKQCQFVEA